MRPLLHRSGLLAFIISALFLPACQTSDIVPKSEGTIQGQGIAYRWNDELWVADVTGQNARRLTANLTSAACAIYAPAPNGRAIAYRDSKNHLWVIQLAGGEATRLSNVPVDDFTWYPSSRGLAYSSGSDLYLQTTTNSAPPTPYSLQGHSVRRPTWSLDNSRIAFYLLRDGNVVDLAVLPFPAASLNDLRVLDTFRMLPGSCPPEIRWAPDGKKLVAGDGSHQFVYFLAGGSPLPLGGGSPAAAWSADSRYLAYLDVKSRLLLRDVFTGDVRILANATAGTYAWNPTGNQIAFTVSSEDENQLALLDLKGRDRVTLVESGVAPGLRPAWSRDGKVLFFGHQTSAGLVGIARVSSDGGAVQQLLPRASDFRLFEKRSE